MDPVESTDFDFFDTPRHQDKHDSDNESEKNNTQPQDSHSKDSVVNSDNTKNRKSISDKRRPSSSLSGSSDGDDIDYSSDSVTSISDSQTDRDQPDKKSPRALSSDSSASSSYRSKNKDSTQSRAGKRSDSESDDNSSDNDYSRDSGRKLKTRMSNRDSKKPTKKVNKESKRKQLEADSYSSSAYSDGEESSNRVSLSHSDHDKRSRSQSNGSKRQEAWGMNKRPESNKDAEESGRKKVSNERPKTAKRRTDHNRRRPNSPPSHSDSEALSDSDITDVSPMDSPRTDNKSKNRSKTSLSGIGAAGDGTNVKAQFRALPLNEKDLENEEDFDQHQVDSAGIDLNILMKAVGELEKKKRVEANSRRVMFAPMTLKRNDKSNYTFTRDKTHDIDRENDRLLKEIVKQVQADRKKQYHQSPATPKYKLTPSAINREKEMKRIETDNLNFLKRLQKVKATSTISRSHQLKEYENTKLHGIPISTLHPMSRASSRASQLTDSFSSIGSRTRSLTSLHSVASTVRSTSSKRSSRPGSATKRVDNRPEWNDRW